MSQPHREWCDLDNDHDGPCRPAPRRPGDMGRPEPPDPTPPAPAARVFNMKVQMQLEKLVEIGLYGSTVDEVVDGLVRKGLLDLIREGVLSLV